jgi:hypothetical protein
MTGAGFLLTTFPVLGYTLWQRKADPNCRVFLIVRQEYPVYHAGDKGAA